jgi:hypothetical protein
MVIQATFNEFQHPFLGVDLPQFLGQVGMPSKLAADEKPIAFLSSVERSRGTRVHALTAEDAPLKVDLRTAVVHQPDRLFPARLDAGKTSATGLLGNPRTDRADQAEITNLRSGACVGAIGNRDPELMVHFQRTVHALFEEFTKISPQEEFLQFSGKLAVDDGPIRAT